MVGYFCNKAAWLWRVSAGTDASEKMISALNGMENMFQNPIPSLYPRDILIGIAGGAVLRMVVYYKAKNAVSPLYWGNFQNYGGSHFNEIAGTMNLYNYNSDRNTDLFKKFFYENNSMWGKDGVELLNGNNATQGLVAEQLSNNDLQLKTNNGTALAPFFDKDFLNGNNSKNTVLGKVYENVTFPFVKKAMSSSSTESKGTLDYWYFNSSDQEATNKNLQLKYDATDEYFLQSNDEEVKGSTTKEATANGNYFPLNSSKQSGKA